jgi:uncharacterized protein YbaR (Trm112 family)
VNLISEQLLAMVRCPETRAPLTMAAAPLVAALNARVARRELKNRAGDLLEQPLDGALVRQDGAVLYPIINGIPVLVVDEGFPLEHLAPAERCAVSEPANTAADRTDAFDKDLAP